MDQLFAIQQENLQNLLTLQENLARHAGSFIDLQANTAKAQVCNLNNAAKQVLNSKTPQEQTNAISQCFTPIQQQIIEYNKQFFDLISKIGQDVQTNIEGLQKECQKNASNAIDAFSKNSPVGTEQFASYVKSAMTATSKIIEGASKATQQAVNAGYNNVKSQVENATASTGSAYESEKASAANNSQSQPQNSNQQNSKKV